MKVTFISNFLTHHQVFFCLDMKEKLGDDFKFISTIKITQERLNLGYKNLDNDYDFVIRTYESKEQYEKAKRIILESDVAIIGSTSDEYVKDRLEKDLLTFRYRERIFQSGIKTFFNKEKMKNIYERHIKYKKNKNLYMLCASAYGANDFYKINRYKNKTYKWGYFPETKIYDLDLLIQEKEKNNPIELLWAGRLLKWKHPEYMIEIAKRLKKENYKFHIKILGSGILFDSLKKQINEEKLNNEIELLGPVESHKVRSYMEKANIYIFSSTKMEGWGAVLNEAMNSACAVVADRNIGAVPFLIKDGKNGFMYSSFEELYAKVKDLINDANKRKEISKDAYNTIVQEWNSKKATKNLLTLFENIIKNKETNIEEGPCSKAYPIKIKH